MENRYIKTHSLKNACLQMPDGFAIKGEVHPDIKLVFNKIRKMRETNY